MRERIKSKLKLMGNELDGAAGIDDNVEDKLLFHFFFLKPDEDQSLEVKAVKEVDYAEVEKRLEGGESVFISRKRRQHLDPRPFSMEDTPRHWYIPHV